MRQAEIEFRSEIEKMVRGKHGREHVLSIFARILELSSLRAGSATPAVFLFDNGYCDQRTRDAALATIQWALRIASDRAAAVPYPDRRVNRNQVEVLNALTDPAVTLAGIVLEQGVSGPPAEYVSAITGAIRSMYSLATTTGNEGFEILLDALLEQSVPRERKRFAR